MTDRPDPIDEQLQGYAARWRDALPPPPAVPTDLPTHSAGFGRRGRGVAGWLPLVAAAAVLAVVVVAVRLGQGGTDLGSVGGPTASATTTATSSATATGSAVNNGVVPWVPLPAPTRPSPRRQCPPHRIPRSPKAFRYAVPPTSPRQQNAMARAGPVSSSSRSSDLLGDTPAESRDIRPSSSLPTESLWPSPWASSRGSPRISPCSPPIQGLCLSRLTQQPWPPSYGRTGVRLQAARRRFDSRGRDRLDTSRWTALADRARVRPTPRQLSVTPSGALRSLQRPTPRGRSARPTTRSWRL